MQLDKLELKLTESRRQNHARHSALQQVGKTIEADTARLEHQLTQQRRLETMQNAAAAGGGSKFQRSLSFDSETRAKSGYYLPLQCKTRRALQESIHLCRQHANRIVGFSSTPCTPIHI